MLITRLRLEAKSRSWFAYQSACLGLLALHGVACFHFPDLLTSRDFRTDNTEGFARQLVNDTASRFTIG